MSDVTLLFLNQAVRLFEDQCRSASSQIQRARTMREVKHASDIHPVPYIRHMPQCRRHLADLRNEGEKKMERLLADQLKLLASSPDAETMKQARGRLLITEWPFLRGTFSRIYAHAERESRNLIHAATALTDSGDDPADQDHPTAG